MLITVFRYLYWTDLGTEPFIGRMGMDGSRIVKLITKDIYWPDGITIDYYSDHIYWVDAGLVRVE